MDIRSSQKTTSSVSAVNVFGNIAEILALMGIGALGVLLHAYFRVPLKIPGHHGVIYMALLIGGKLLSKKPYASSLSSAGASLMLFVPLGFHDPFMPLLYLLPGFITDLGFRFGQKWTKSVWLVALICGLAYMTIPLSRIIITSFTGFPFSSFIGGFLRPTLFHFVFGFAGGLAGTSLVRIFRKKSQ